MSEATEVTCTRYIDVLTGSHIDFAQLPELNLQQWPLCVEVDGSSYWRLTIDIYCYLRIIIRGIKAEVEKGRQTQSTYKAAFARFMSHHELAAAAFGEQALRAAADNFIIKRFTLPQVEADWTKKAKAQQRADKTSQHASVAPVAPVVALKSPTVEVEAKADEGARSEEKAKEEAKTIAIDRTIEGITNNLDEELRAGKEKYNAYLDRENLSPNLVMGQGNPKEWVPVAHAIISSSADEGKAPGYVIATIPAQLPLPPRSAPRSEGGAGGDDERLPTQPHAHSKKLAELPDDRARKIELVKRCLFKISRDYPPGCIAWLKKNKPEHWTNLNGFENAVELAVADDKSTPSDVATCLIPYWQSWRIAFRDFDNAHADETCELCGFVGRGILVDVPTTRPDGQPISQATGGNFPDRQCVFCAAMTRDKASAIFAEHVALQAAESEAKRQRQREYEKEEVAKDFPGGQDAEPKAILSQMPNGEAAAVGTKKPAKTYSCPCGDEFTNPRAAGAHKKTCSTAIALAKGQQPR